MRLMRYEKTSGTTAGDQEGSSYAFYSQGLEGLLSDGKPITVAEVGQSVSLDLGGELLSMPIDSLEATPAGIHLTLRLRARHDIFIDAMLNGAKASLFILGRQLFATIDKIDLKQGAESVRLIILKDYHGKPRL